MNVTVLTQSEEVRLDIEQIGVLYRSYGADEAERRMTVAAERLAIALAEIGERAPSEPEFGLSAISGVERLATELGMVALARVARDVTDSGRRGDTNAFHATLARLLRLGETSLAAMWGL
ncbi:MAG: hypothetical protein AAF405_08495 [Pseudomonadota bacterium]